MKKRLKFLGVTFMALLMILLAFSGAAFFPKRENDAGILLTDAPA